MGVYSLKHIPVRIGEARGGRRLNPMGIIRKLE
jgi:hypothetical protein